MTKKKLKVILTDVFYNSFNRLFSNNPIYSIPRKIRDIRSNIKYAYQRITKHYDDPSVWDFHSLHSKYVIDTLTELEDMVNGYPASIIKEKNNDDRNLKEWKNIIRKIRNGFEAAEKISNIEYMKEIKLKKPKKDIFGRLSYTSYKYDKQTHKKLQKEFEEGIDLMKKYYFSLWD